MKNIMNERLKLLSTFKVVFSERTLGDAAQVLGCSQSSVSKQLQKLRDWFEDDLFVRTGGGMQPTARATALIERIEAVLAQIEALSDSAPFNPRVLEGRFVIQTTDEITQRLAAPLIRSLQQQAPAVRLGITRLEKDYAIRELESGRVDIVISVNWGAPEQLIQKRMFEEHFVVVMGAGHRLARKRLTLETYADASHLMVAPLDSQRGFIDEVMDSHGLSRRLVATVPGFSEITPALLGNEFLVTLPSRVAERLSATDQLVVRPLPFSAPSYNYYMFWHRRFASDPRHHWLRQQAELALLT